MARRFRNADPTANAAVKAADRAKGIPTAVALERAAEAKRRGDLGGWDRFMAMARRGDAE